jgi:hypothetical protein
MTTVTATETDGPTVCVIAARRFCQDAKDVHALPRPTLERLWHSLRAPAWVIKLYPARIPSPGAPDSYGRVPTVVYADADQGADGLRFDSRRQAR